MTEQDQNLTTADIANRETKNEKEAEDTERPLQRDPEAREESPEAVGTRDELEPLLAPDDTEGFRSRWESIQTGFVDEPRQTVEQADSLVAELMQRLAESFTEERASLESQWSRGDDVSTEDLRVGLQRYRSFFERLLST